MDRLTASGLIDLVLDEGSWESWDTTPERSGLSEQYAGKLAAAQAKSGQTESA